MVAGRGAGVRRQAGARVGPGGGRLTEAEFSVDRDRWDRSHAAGASPTLSRLRRQTLTKALPPDVEPTTMWPSWPLERVRDELELRPGETLADLGCGRGEIGLWLAASAGARLIGVDPSAVGLELARERAAAHGVDATFVEGVLQRTGLDDAVADAVVITDVMHFVEQDRMVALQEVARVLRPGRRLVVVGPERRDTAADLRAAGFEVEVRSETPEWRETVSAFAAAVEGSADELRAELGHVADELVQRAGQLVGQPRWHGLTAARRPAAVGS